MAKSKTSKRSRAAEAANIETSRSVPRVFSGKTLLLQLASIVALASILYGNTLGHQYALDDAIVLTENRFVQRGLKGIPQIMVTDTFAGRFGENSSFVAGGRYRPLSLVTFAIEYQFLGKNPRVSHLINLLLYALSGVVLYLVLKRCVNPSYQITSFLNVPFMCAMLYIAHPIHTEAVANIKGRDEILCVLALLVTLYLFLKNHDSRGWLYYVAGLTAFFLALLSKENALTFVVVIPLTLYFFRNAKARELTIVAGGLILVAGLYAIVRQACVASSGENEIKEVLNNPFVHASLSEKYATIANILGRYLQLLLFPHPLSHDYYCALFCSGCIRRDGNTQKEPPGL